eukprot:g81900.t1
MERALAPPGTRELWNGTNLIRISSVLTGAGVYPSSANCVECANMAYFDRIRFEAFRPYHSPSVTTVGRRWELLSRTNSTAFNNAFWASPEKIIMRVCGDCQSFASFQTLYYRRKWHDQFGINMTAVTLTNFLLTTPHEIHRDFNIFSTLDDALAGRNPWLFCSSGGVNRPLPAGCSPTSTAGPLDRTNLTFYAYVPNASSLSGPQLFANLSVGTGLSNTTPGEYTDALAASGQGALRLSMTRPRASIFLNNTRTGVSAPFKYALIRPGRDYRLSLTVTSARDCRDCNGSCRNSSTWSGLLGQASGNTTCQAYAGNVTTLTRECPNLANQHDCSRNSVLNCAIYLTAPDIATTGYGSGVGANWQNIILHSDVVGHTFKGSQILFMRSLFPSFQRISMDVTVPDTAVPLQWPEITCWLSEHRGPHGYTSDVGGTLAPLADVVLDDVQLLELPTACRTDDFVCLEDNTGQSLTLGSSNGNRPLVSFVDVNDQFGNTFVRATSTPQPVLDNVDTNGAFNCASDLGQFGSSSLPAVGQKAAQSLLDETDALCWQLGFSTSVTAATVRASHYYPANPPFDFQIQPLEFCPELQITVSLLAARRACTLQATTFTSTPFSLQACALATARTEGCGESFMMPISGANKCRCCSSSLQVSSSVGLPDPLYDLYSLSRGEQDQVAREVKCVGYQTSTSSCSKLGWPVRDLGFYSEETMSTGACIAGNAEMQNDPSRTVSLEWVGNGKLVGGQNMTNQTGSSGNFRIVSVTDLPAPDGSVSSGWAVEIFNSTVATNSTYQVNNRLGGPNFTLGTYFLSAWVRLTSTYNGLPYVLRVTFNAANGTVLNSTSGAETGCAADPNIRGTWQLLNCSVILRSVPARFTLQLAFPGRPTLGSLFFTDVRVGNLPRRRWLPDRFPTNFAANAWPDPTVCPPALPLEEAVEFCGSAGARLCTAGELYAGLGTEASATQFANGGATVRCEFNVEAPFLTTVDAICNSTRLCRVCDGNCRNNSDCAAGLRCFTRIGTQSVPGCQGLGVSGRGYCYVSPGTIQTAIVQSVYYAGVDITSKVTGSLSDQTVIKTVSFRELPGERLVIAVRGQVSGDHACNSAAFRITCRCTDETSPWHNLASSSNSPRLAVHGSVTDIWSTAISQGWVKNAFDWTTLPALVPCVPVTQFKISGNFTSQVTPIWPNISSLFAYFAIDGNSRAGCPAANSKRVWTLSKFMTGLGDYANETILCPSQRFISLGIHNENTSPAYLNVPLLTPICASKEQRQHVICCADPDFTYRWPSTCTNLVTSLPMWGEAKREGFLFSQFSADSLRWAGCPDPLKCDFTSRSLYCQDSPHVYRSTNGDCPSAPALGNPIGDVPLAFCMEQCSADNNCLGFSFQAASNNFKGTCQKRGGNCAVEYAALSVCVVNDFQTCTSLGLCTGPCSSNSNCGTGLQCVVPAANAVVPGCDGRAAGGVGYCHDPTRSQVMYAPCRAGSNVSCYYTKDVSAEPNLRLGISDPCSPLMAQVRDPLATVQPDTVVCANAVNTSGMAASPGSMRESDVNRMCISLGYAKGFVSRYANYSGCVPAAIQCPASNFDSSLGRWTLDLPTPRPSLAMEYTCQGHLVARLSEASRHTQSGILDDGRASIYDLDVPAMNIEKASFSSSAYSPFCGSCKELRSTTFYSAYELGRGYMYPGDTILGIGFYLDNLPAFDIYQLRIAYTWLPHSFGEQLFKDKYDRTERWDQSEMTIVFYNEKLSKNGMLPYTGKVAMFALSAPVVWDGSSHLLVQWFHDNPKNESSNDLAGSRIRIVSHNQLWYNGDYKYTKSSSNTDCGTFDDPYCPCERFTNYFVPLLNLRVKGPRQPATVAHIGDSFVISESVSAQWLFYEIDFTQEEPMPRFTVQVENADPVYTGDAYSVWDRIRYNGPTVATHIEVWISSDPAVTRPSPQSYNQFVFCNGGATNATKVSKMISISNPGKLTFRFGFYTKSDARGHAITFLGDLCPKFNNSACNEINGAGVCVISICQCNPGWSGVACNWSDAVQCNGKGRVQMNGDCLCDPIYAGKRCEECSQDPVSRFNWPGCVTCDVNITCLGRGRCNSVGGCICDANYAGTACQSCAPSYYGLPRCVFCARNSTCRDRGSCSAADGTCVCEHPFTGVGCGQCLSGYFGPTCLPCLPTAANPCFNFGQCMDGASGNGTCVCNVGYRGPTCQDPSIRLVEPSVVDAEGGSRVAIEGVFFLTQTGRAFYSPAWMGLELTIGTNGWTGEYVTAIVPPYPLAGARVPVLIETSSGRSSNTDRTVLVRAARPVSFLSQEVFQFEYAAGFRATITGTGMGTQGSVWLDGMDVTSEWQVVCLTCLPPNPPTGNEIYSVLELQPSVPGRNVSDLSAEPAGCRLRCLETLGCGGVAVVSNEALGVRCLLFGVNSPSLSTTQAASKTRTVDSGGIYVWYVLKSRLYTKWTHSEINLFIPAGVGTGHRLIIHGAAPADMEFVFDYELPMLNALAANPQRLGTAGGSVITILGRNFGISNTSPNTRPSVYLLPTAFSPAASQLCLYISHTDTEIVCQLPAGTGERLLQVSVSGQNSLVQPGRSYVYAAPTLYKARGCEDGGVYTGGGGINWTINCPISGGINITLFGENFGPVAPTGSDILSVMVGARPCDQVQWLSPISLRCRLAGGYGRAETISVKRAGLQGAGVALLGYNSPWVLKNTLRLLGPFGESQPDGLVKLPDIYGGHLISFEGENFWNDVTKISVWVGPLEAVKSGYTCSVTNVTAVANVTGVSRVICQLTPCVGVHLHVYAEVDGVGSNLGADYMSTPPAQLLNGTLELWPMGKGHVVDPFTSTLIGKSTDGEEVTFLGKNLGIVGQQDALVLQIGFYQDDVFRQAFRATCEIIDLLGVINQTERVVCIMPPNTNLEEATLFFRPVAGPGSSAQVGLVSRDRYEFPAGPEIVSLSGCPENDPFIGTMECPTEGGVSTKPQTLVTITGRRFTNAGAQVYLGFQLCLSLRHMDNDTEVQCLLPPAVGFQLSLVVRAGGLLSKPTTLTLSYAAPRITSLSSSNCIPDTDGSIRSCPREGGSVITIQGKHFGPSGATVLIGSSLCINVTHGRPGGQGFDVQRWITCVIPQGGTILNPVLVVQNGGVSSAQGRSMVNRYVSYRQCAAGTAAKATEVDCVLCSVGSFSGLVGQTSCRMCQPGFKSSYLRQNCDPCPRGTVSDREGAADCVKCETGSFEPSLGSTSCGKCKAGLFASGEGNRACTPCSLGRYNNGTGASSCRKCEAGKEGPNQGLSSCAFCQPGTFAAEEGVAKCISCPPGFISSNGAFIGGSTSCLDCTEGKYAPLAGGSECLICSKGESSGSRAAACIPCEKGKASGTEGSGSCTSCTAGKFASKEGSEFCSDCGTGRYSPSNKAYDCIACPVGKRQDVPGMSYCTECERGFFVPTTAQTQSIPCGLGTFTNSTGVSACVACDPGFISMQLEGSTGCLPCQKGSYSSKKAQVECLLCGQGFVALSTGATGCTACDPGYFVENLQKPDHCSPCPEGKFSQYAATACEDCNPGFYANGTGNEKCTPCEPGYAQGGEGRSACDDCPKGTYTSLRGELICIVCPEGTYANKKNTVKCTECEPGKFVPSSPEGAQFCLPCEAGWVSPNSGLAACWKCEAGYYAGETGLTGCDHCGEGTFAGAPAASACSECPIGKYNKLTRSTSCLDCSTGTYVDREGSTDCVACSAGTAQSATGMSFCQLCKPGYFVTSIAQPVCKECLPGRFSNESGLTHECPPCSEGKYQELQAKSSCKLCVPGKYSDEQTATFCKQCDPGKYQSGSGMTACDSCVPGLYQSFRQMTSCDLCPAGKQALQVAAVECVPCLPGFFRDANQSECSPCAPGYFQNEPGQSNCRIVKAGQHPSPNRDATLACDNFAITPLDGFDKCIPCPFHSSANDARTWCLCQAEWYGEVNFSEAERKFDMTCHPCPIGGECSSAGVQFDSLQAMVGWWRSDEESLQFYRCVMPSHCLGGHNSSCGENREGPLCSLCQVGFSSSTGLSPCLPCPEVKTSMGLTVLVCCIIVAGILAMYYAILRTDRSLLQMAKDREAARLNQLLKTEKQHQQAFEDYEVVQVESLTQAQREMPNFTYKFKILLSFLQICTNLTFVVDVPWPPLYARFINLFSFVNLDFVPWQSLGCVAAFDFYIRLMLTMATPIGVILLVVVGFLLPKLHSVKVRYGDANEDIEDKVELAQHEQRLLDALEAKSKQEAGGKKKKKKKKDKQKEEDDALKQGGDVLSPEAKKRTRRLGHRLHGVSMDFDQMNPEEITELLEESTTENDMGRTRVQLANTLKNTEFWLPELAVESKEIDPLHQARKRTWRKFWKLVLFTLFLVYPSVSATVVAAFVCQDINGVLYLKADYTQRCLDERWWRYLPLAVSGVILYPLGIPAFFYYLLSRYKTRLDLPDIQAQLGFLYQGFTRRTWWFELMDMLHKLVLTSLIAFFKNEWQMASAMAFSTFYTCIIVVMEPYLRREEDQLHLLVQTELLMLLLCGYILTEFKTVKLDLATDVMLSTILITLNIMVVFVTLGLAGYNLYKLIMKKLRRRHTERQALIQQEMSERAQRLRLMRARAEQKLDHKHAQVVLSAKVPKLDNHGVVVEQGVFLTLSAKARRRKRESAAGRESEQVEIDSLSDQELERLALQRLQVSAVIAELAAEERGITDIDDHEER